MAVKRSDEENAKRLQTVKDRLAKDPTLTRGYFAQRGYHYCEMDTWVAAGEVTFGKAKQSYQGYVINPKKGCK